MSQDIITNASKAPREIKTQISEGASKFHLFPDLPKELRLQIWKLAMAPRVITLSLKLPTMRYPPSYDTVPPRRLIPSPWKRHHCLIPLLSTCSESRGEVKKFYVEYCARDSTQYHPRRVPGLANFMINYANDAVYLDANTCASILFLLAARRFTNWGYSLTDMFNFFYSTTNLASIQHLIVDCRHWRPLLDKNVNTENYASILYFKALKKLSLLLVPCPPYPEYPKILKIDRWDMRPTGAKLVQLDDMGESMDKIMHPVWVDILDRAKNEIASLKSQNPDWSAPEVNFVKWSK